MVSADVRWLGPDDTVAKRAPHLDVGHPDDDHSTHGALCLFSLDGHPTLCVGLRRTSDETYTFRDARYWRGLFVVGWGDAFYVIDPESSLFGVARWPRYNLPKYRHCSLCLGVVNTFRCPMEPDHA